MNKLSYEYVKEFFKKANCTLLEDSYKNSWTKLKFICHCGNTHYITFNKFQYRKRCAKCGNNIKDYKEVKTYFDNANCELLSLEYKDVKSELEYICPKGHLCTTTFARFQKGQRCKKCAIFNIHEPKRQKALEFIKSQGYKIVDSSNYKNRDSYILIKCPNNHSYQVKWGNFQIGARCATCQHINFRGKNNPNWIDGLSKIRKSERYAVRQPSHSWKNSLLWKYNFICQKCKKQLRKKHLVGHHLNGWKWAVEDRFNEKNGACLCVSCHKEFHNKYGYTNNTIIQYNDWNIDNPIMNIVLMAKATNHFKCV